MKKTRPEVENLATFDSHFGGNLSPFGNCTNEKDLTPLESGLSPFIYRPEIENLAALDSHFTAVKRAMHCFTAQVKFLALGHIYKLKRPDSNGIRS